jgi:hypothetical protein
MGSNASFPSYMEVVSAFIEGDGRFSVILSKESS